MKIDIISATAADVAAAKVAMIKLNNSDRNLPRRKALSLKQEWAIARFGRTARERNVALLFIMDRASSKKAWTEIHHHLREVQSVVDREVRVFVDFIEKSPDRDVVNWFEKARERLTDRIKDGWTPPFTVQVVVKEPVLATKPAGKKKAPSKTRKAAKPETAANDAHEADSARSVHGVTTNGRFVRLEDFRMSAVG